VHDLAEHPEDIYCAMVLSLRDYVDKNRFPGVVLGLSGGIDSPVAAWRLMKRGCRAVFIHFHGHPFVTRASADKAEELARHLTRHQYHSRLYLVPFGDIQRQIVLDAPAPLRVVLYRRLMVRIAEEIGRENNCWALVTGDSLGQVAISSDGKGGYIANMKNRGFATTSNNIDLGWVVGQRLTRVDLDTAEPSFATLSLDPRGKAAADAHGVAVSRNNKFLAVSLGGTHEVMIFRTNGRRLPYYTQVNAGLSHVFRGSGGAPLTARFDVVNLLDREYEIRDGTGVGVGAPQFGPRRGFFVGLSRPL